MVALRSVLTVVLLVVWCGSLCGDENAETHIESELTALNALRSSKAEIQMCRDKDSGDVTELHFMSNASDKDVRWISSFCSLKVLSISDSKVSPEAFQQITELKELHTVYIIDVPLKDRGLAHFPKNLQELLISDAGITKQSIKFISTMRRLRSLSLYDLKRIKNGDFLPLGNLKQLTHLDIRNTSFGDNDVRCLLDMPKLKSLDLGGTSITDQAVPVLIKISTLEDVDIFDSRLSKDGLDNVFSSVYKRN